MGSLVLQLFGCGEEGLEAPIQYGGVVTKGKWDYFKVSMPLVAPSTAIDIGGLISGYQEEFENVDFQIGLDTERSHSILTGTVEFSEYELTYKSSEPQPVMALSTGSLNYLHDDGNNNEEGKSNANVLGGAIPNTGEGILILKPTEFHRDKWEKFQPSRSDLLEECAYLNVQMLDFEALKELVGQAATKDSFKQRYKEKTNTEWLESGDWKSDFVDMFLKYADWGLVVNGGSKIAMTKPSPSDPQEQRLSMFFKIGDNWSAHFDAVKILFQYLQRGPLLSGHPLIAKLLGRSVEVGTVDLVPISISNNRNESGIEEFSYEYVKDNLVLDFKFLETNPVGTEPHYHPLALDPDEHPHHLIVARHSLNALPDELVTRLKIHNPLGLQIEFGGNISPGVTLSPMSFSTTEQVVEIQASSDLPADTKEMTIAITMSDGSLITELVLIFLEVFRLPVKFWNVADNIASHDTMMTETRLRKVIAHVNGILGSQTKVYIYPVEENGRIIEDLPYNGDLGDVVPLSLVQDLAKQIISSSESKDINVLFVWDQKDQGDQSIEGATFPSLGYYRISADTQGKGKDDDVFLANTLVHELGHWFSSIFYGLASTGGGLSDCSDDRKHFNHKQVDLSGCTGADWSFRLNLMAPDGDYLITLPQAHVFNNNAHKVLPYIDSDI